MKHRFTGLFVATTVFFSATVFAEDFQTVINNQRANADALTKQAQSAAANASFLAGQSGPNAQAALQQIGTQLTNAQNAEAQVDAEDKAMKDVAAVQDWAKKCAIANPSAADYCNKVAQDSLAADAPALQQLQQQQQQQAQLAAVNAANPGLVQAFVAQVGAINAATAAQQQAIAGAEAAAQKAGINDTEQAAATEAAVNQQHDDLINATFKEFEAFLPH